jgi:hypothetical protein
LLLVLGCAFAIFRLSLRSKLNARIAAIRAAGHPVTWAELDRWYAIPDGADNAADAIMNALSYCQQWEHQALEPLPFVGHAELPSRTQPLAAETMSLMSEYLDDNRKALDKLHEAVADVKYCRYPVDFNAGIEIQMVQMSHLSDLRRGARLLQLEAISRAEKDEAELAVRSVISVLRLGNSLANEPSLGSYYNQRACRQFAVLGLERIVNRTDLTNEQLTRLSEALADAEELTELLPGLIGERCVGLAGFRMSTAQLRATGLFDGDRNESQLSIHLSVATFALRKYAGRVDKNAILFLDAANDCIEALRLPLERRHAVADDIEKRLGSASRNDLLLNFALHLPRVLVEFDAFARLRTARAALAVQRYRLAAGELPDTLADLVPAYLDTVPTDPFDGNELRYEKLGPGFVVYSIGDDLRDDGGMERLPGSKTAGQFLPRTGAGCGRETGDKCPTSVNFWPNSPNRGNNL